MKTCRRKWHPLPFYAFCGSVWRTAMMKAGTVRLKFGMFLLLSNVPFGYGSLLICGILAAARQNPLWLHLGTACYFLSWLMLGAGILLVGLDAKRLLSETVRRKWRAWRRLRHAAA